MTINNDVRWQLITLDEKKPGERPIWKKQVDWNIFILEFFFASYVEQNLHKVIQLCNNNFLIDIHMRG